MTAPIDESLLSAGTAVLDRIEFDPEAYIARHADVREAGLGVLDAARHLLTYGAREGRSVAFGGSLTTAIEVISTSPLSPDVRAVLIRCLARSRVEELGSHDASPGRLADAIVASDLFRPLLLFGDSHVRYYAELDLMQEEGGCWLPLPMTCWAGSARGLSNPRARGGYGSRILTFVRAHADRIAAARSLVFVKFGQVDLEFVFNFKRMGPPPRPAFQPLDYLEFVVDCVDRYVVFLRELRAATPREVPVVVASVFPPTLSDDAAREGYVNAHVAEMEDAGEAESIAQVLKTFEMPSWKVRTLFHVLFNRELAERCRSVEGLSFIDDCTPLLGPDGIVDDRFIAPHGGTDHHVAPNADTRGVILSVGRRLEAAGRGL